MRLEEPVLKQKQLVQWLFLFSCMALFHSVWTGWLAPVGLFVAKHLAARCASSAFAVGIGMGLSVAAGIGVGLGDALLLRTMPTVGTAFLLCVGFVGLSAFEFPSGSLERRWFGFHVLFMITWISVFLSAFNFT